VGASQGRSPRSDPCDDPKPDERFLANPPLFVPVAEIAFPRALAFWFYFLAFFAGVTFYVVWGLSYGSWNLLREEWVGAYAVTVILVGFGLVGMLLYRK
jgi:hypothetical protein